jgi:uroporphyrinogen-III synthase
MAARKLWKNYAASSNQIPKMENPIRILSTKKLLPNQRQYLLNAEFSVVEADYIQITKKEFDHENQNDYLIFTSRNSVESVLANKNADHFKTVKSFCVGEKTKFLLEENGFEVIFCSDYAAELASVICNQYQKDSFTFFSGSLRQDILPDAMQLAQIRYDEVEVYETTLTPHKAGAKPDGILFFSPSAVESYLQENTITDEMCFCIGNTTASAVEEVTQNLIIANKPTVENVIIQCINHYNRKQ